MMGLLRIQDIVDDRLCYERVREMRWADGVSCPHCQCKDYNRHGHHNSTEHRYRYHCKGCKKHFDDLTNTIFQGHHQPLKVWIVCLYLMGLNLSNAQIASELGLTKNDCHAMTSLLREGICEKRPQEILEGEVEFDELYVVAGHKGHPESVKKKDAKDAAEG
jgi:transposase-like protein